MTTAAQRRNRRVLKRMLPEILGGLFMTVILFGLIAIFVFVG